MLWNVKGQILWANKIHKLLQEFRKLWILVINGPGGPGCGAMWSMRMRPPMLPDWPARGPHSQSCWKLPRHGRGPRVPVLTTVCEGSWRFGFSGDPVVTTVSGAWSWTLSAPCLKSCPLGEGLADKTVPWFHSMEAWLVEYISIGSKFGPHGFRV